MVVYLTLSIIKSYLTGRYQRVTLYKNESKCFVWKDIQCGVPQGSVLGLLFLLYINDLPGSLSDLAKPVLFVEDASYLNIG
jgi:hypothetical protein